MNKLDVIKGPSCLTNAFDDEPLFVLRANDELAPMIVRFWAMLYEHTKDGPSGMSATQREKWREATDTAAFMESWRFRRYGAGSSE